MLLPLAVANGVDAKDSATQSNESAHAPAKKKKNKLLRTRNGGKSLSRIKKSRMKMAEKKNIYNK